MPEHLHFYGVTLTKDKPSAEWKQVSYIDKKEAIFKTKLHIKQILLGHDATPDEFNVVQLQLGGPKSPPQTVAVLKLAEAQSSLADIELFQGTVKFQLTKGSGPVHIMGLLFPEMTGSPDEPELFDSEEEHFEDEDDEEEVDLKGAGDHKAKGARAR